MLECGVKNAQSVTEAALDLDEQYLTAGADRAAGSIVRALGSCMKGCEDAPPFEDRPQAAKKEEAMPLSKLYAEDAQAALGGCGGAARRQHGDEFSDVSGIRGQDLMELSKEDFVQVCAHH